MTKNLRSYTRDSKSYVSDRGSPQGATRTAGAQFRPEDFTVLSDAAVQTTLAMHEAWVRNLGCLNQFYKEAHGLVRPFYMFPLEMAQQYFSYIFGFPQCVSEGVGKQRKRRSVEHIPGLRLARVEQHADQDEREEIEQAMDIATGANTELWVEVVEVGRGAAMAA